MGGYSWNRHAADEGPMGTDIHLYVERRRARSTLPDQVFAWEVVPPPVRDLTKWPITAEEKKIGRSSNSWGPNECMRSYPCDGPNDDGCLGAMCPKCGGCQRYMCWYRNRNYRVFDVLANVRRDCAFVPVALPRGEPLDASTIVKDHHDGEHTPTWLLLSEVLAYPWGDRVGKFTGLLPLRRSSQGMTTYKEWRTQRGEPEQWIVDGAYAGNSSVIVAAKDADRVLRSAKAQSALTKGPYKREILVRVAWQQTAAECCSDFLAFLDQIVEPMLGEEYLEIKRVWQDAIEGGAGLGQSAERQHRENVQRLRDQMLLRAVDLRFVIWFDS